MLTIYSKPQCSFCDQAKAYLQQQAVEFTAIDITQDAEAMSFIKSEGHRTVPQIYKDGTLFVHGGFQGLIQLGRNGLMEKLGN